MRIVREDTSYFVEFLLNRGYKVYGVGIDIQYLKNKILIYK